MRILIVEDNARIRNFLKKSLEAECFAVDVAETGAEGKKLFRVNEYDLIILDNHLPDTTGVDLCVAIREQACVAPILMLSVNGETDTKITALDNGADDYLTKPFSLSELMARVRALLRRQPHIEDQVLSLYDITLDTKRHTVTKDGVEINLTRKEFMLLEYLMRHQGTVLSRGMIMEHVWDMNADPFSNTIESHILSLRKKLGVGESKEYIKTISGYGYKFE